MLSNAMRALAERAEHEIACPASTLHAVGVPMELPTCQRCGAVVTIPADLTVLQMNCQFCGWSQPVPDAIERRRLLLVAQRQQAEVSIAATAAADKSRATRIESWIMPLCIGIGIVAAMIVAVVLALSSASSSSAGESTPSKTYDPADPKVNGENRVKKLVEGRKENGCRTLKHPAIETYAADVKGGGVTIPKGHCFVMMIATGTGQSLDYTLRVTDGEVVESERGSEMQTWYCAKKDVDEYTLEIKTPGVPYAFAELECPKDR